VTSPFPTMKTGLSAPSDSRRAKMRPSRKIDMYSAGCLLCRRSHPLRSGLPTIREEPLQVLLREVGEDGNFFALSSTSASKSLWATGESRFCVAHDTFADYW